MVHTNLELRVRDSDPSSQEYHEELPDCGLIIKKNIRKCDRNVFLNRFPILKWLPKYELSFLLPDFVAGLAVGLTAIPQVMAQAVIAGLEPQFGLYAAFMPCFVYLIFGSLKDITIGPTAIMAIMIQQYVALNVDFAILASFLSGVFIFMLGVLNLGFIVQFISIPVTAGFTTAAAITIGSGQVRSLLGIRSGSSGEFLSAWISVFRYISETRLWDTVLGVASIIFLLILRKIKDVKKFSTFFKYLSLARNALVVIIGMTLAYFLSTDGVGPFLLTGNITAGFPAVQPPPFTTVVGDEILSFGDMIRIFGGNLVALPLISILGLISVAKSFSKGTTIDATQEMLALGLCNIVSSFFMGMPVTGSFTRSAVNNSSGVKTTFGGVFTAMVVILALGFLTSTFYFIPRTTLAALILVAMYFMLEFDTGVQIWKTKKLDIVPFVVTIIACLFLGLEYGILAGIGINIIFILFSTARPNSKIEIVQVRGQDVLYIIPDQSLVFSAAEPIRNTILKSAIRNDAALIVIDGSFINSIDVTVASNLKSVVDDLVILKKVVVFWNWQKQPIGVAWRWSSSFGKLFRNGDNIEDLFNFNENDDEVDEDLKALTIEKL